LGVGGVDVCKSLKGSGVSCVRVVTKPSFHSGVVGEAWKSSTCIRSPRFGSLVIPGGAASSSGAVVGMASFGKLDKDLHLQVYENVEELSNSLAEHVAQLSASAVKDRGAFTVVLSGGSLIKTLG
jgi:hypothetical protein